MRAALLEALLEDMEKEVLLHCTETARLRDLFETLVKEAIPEASFAYADQERISAISTCFFPKVKNEALLFLLQKKQLFASLGGADRQILAHQFFERGFTHEKAQGAITFSFSSRTQEKEIIEAVRKIQEAYEFLQTASQQGIFHHE